MSDQKSIESSCADLLGFPHRIALMTLSAAPLVFSQRDDRAARLSRLPSPEWPIGETSSGAPATQHELPGDHGRDDPRGMIPASDRVQGLRWFIISRR